MPTSWCFKMADLFSNVNASCNSSHKDHEIVFTIKLSTSSVSLITNLLAILVIFCGRSFKRPIIRSVLYLLVADILLALVQIVELFPVTYKDGFVKVRPGEAWKNACGTFGFLDQVTAWIRDLFVVFVVVQLFLFVKKTDKHPQPQTEKEKIGEACGVCICFLFPFTFNWIPFLDDYYGLSGHWCWIKLVVKDCGDADVLEGLMYMLILYYLPLVCIVLLTSLLCLYILYKWYTSPNKALEIILVILYPVIFDILCLIMTINRIDSAMRIKQGIPPLRSLWILHSVADSGRTVLPSVCVILLLVCHRSKKMLIAQQPAGNAQDQNQNEQTKLIGDVPPN